VGGLFGDERAWAAMRYLHPGQPSRIYPGFFRKIILTITKTSRR